MVTTKRYIIFDKRPNGAGFYYDISLSSRKDDLFRRGYVSVDFLLDLGIPSCKDTKVKRTLVRCFSKNLTMTSGWNSYYETKDTCSFRSSKYGENLVLWKWNLSKYDSKWRHCRLTSNQLLPTVEKETM